MKNTVLVPFTCAALGLVIYSAAERSTVSLFNVRTVAYPPHDPNIAENALALEQS